MSHKIIKAFKSGEPIPKNSKFLYVEDKIEIETRQVPNPQARYYPFLEKKYHIYPEFLSIQTAVTVKYHWFEVW